MRDPLDEKLYETMVLVRVLEEKLQKLCDAGLAGDLHFNKGQEAIAVGACAALRASDKIVTHHRTIAHAVAKGVPLYPLVAELLGKRTGLNGGRAGEMHLSSREHGYEFSFQIVSTCVPVAAGLAYALKYHHKTDDIVAVFFGDAATGNGQFHEGLNIAAIKEVPLLLICENNHLAGNITPEYYEPKRSMMSRRVGSYGIDTLGVDGNDVYGVYRTISEAAEYVREKRRPIFVECDTTRLCWHKQGQRDVRSPEELAHLARRDPLTKLGTYVTDEEAIWKSTKKTVDEVLALVDEDLPPEIFND